MDFGARLLNRTPVLLLALFVALLLLGGPSAHAQGNVRLGPDRTTLRDPELEKDSLHNLEVARHYFKLKKAYVAAIKRCEEIIAANPNFAKMDEVLFIAGESSLRLAQKKGKQVSKLTPQQLREDARDYLSQLVHDFPDSQYRDQAEEALRDLGGSKQKEESRR